MDCLLFNDLSLMRLSSNLAVEPPKEWCTGNSNCYGFTVYDSSAYFKGPGCKEDLYYNRYRFTYIKEVYLDRVKF